MTSALGSASPLATGPTLDHSIRRAHGFEPLQLEGQLPRGLRGTLYRTGPGLLQRFGRPVAHPFDADGAVTAIRLGDGAAAGATVVVASKEYDEEERAGRFLYGTSASRLRQVYNNLTGHKKSTGNTNLLWWQDRLFALMENARPQELDPATLGSLGTTDLGVVRDGFSAHPHRVAALSTTFNFGIRGKHIDLFALPDHGAPRLLGSFEAPWISMVHDFIATDKHLVFVIGPAKLITWRAMFAVGDLSQYFRWDPDAGAMVVVVPLACPERVTRFLVDTFWVWHFVNAFEDGDSIAVELCRHDTFSAFAAPSSAGPEHGQPQYYRFRLDPRRELFEGTPLWSDPAEFPSVDPRRAGARQRFTFLQTFPAAQKAPGVARFDCESGEVQAWAAPSTHLGVEPVFVPGGGDEEGAGWILQLFQDPAAGRSYLAVLDAEHLAAPPLARIWMPEAVPMTFHGVFVKAP